MSDYLRHWIGVLCASILGLAVAVVVVAVVCWIFHRAFFMTPDNDYDRESQTVARTLIVIITLLLLIFGAAWGLQ